MYISPVAFIKNEISRNRVGLLESKPRKVRGFFVGRRGIVTEQALETGILFGV